MTYQNWELNWENPLRPFLEINHQNDQSLKYFHGKQPTKVQIEGETIRVWFEEPKTPPKTQKLWVETVLEITRGRRDNYGRPLINFCRIALLWSTYLEHDVSLQDVALMMDLLKTARLMHDYTEDGFLDKLGYIDCVNDMLVQLGGGLRTLSSSHWDCSPEEALRKRDVYFLNSLLAELNAAPVDASSDPQTLAQAQTGQFVLNRHGYDPSSLGQ